MRTKKVDLVKENKVFAYIAVATALILSIPFVMSQTSQEWDWNLPDFIIVGALIFGMGSLFIFVARVTNPKYRLLIGLGFMVVLMLMYVHLAVGIVDTWPLAGS